MSSPDPISDCKVFQNKSSPFCNGINKSLLTPCRQIGLSRKRKTPIGNLSKHSSEDLNNSVNDSTINSISIKSFTENVTTPVTHTKTSSRRRKLDILPSALTASSKSQNRPKRESDELYGHIDEKKTKRELLRTFTSEDLFDSSDDISYSPKMKKSDSVTDKITCVSDMNSEYVSAVQCLNDINDGQVPDTAEYGNSNEITKKCIIFNIDSDSDDDFVLGKSSKNTQKSVKNKKLRVRPQRKLSENNFDESKPVTELKVQLQKLNEKDAGCVKNKHLDEACKSELKTFSRECSSNITDDADFFTSTPEEEKSKRKILEKKMRILESEVKQKQLLLENLERASIYKGKHKIQDLKQLTSVWSEGCGQALKDLLTHLQAHSSIDLNTLLNNMKIPREIVSKLPLNCN